MSKIASPFAKWSNKDHRIMKVDVALLDQNISALHHHSVMIKVLLDAKTFWGLPLFSSDALWKWVKTRQKLLPSASWMEWHVRSSRFPVGSVIRNAPRCRNFGWEAHGNFDNPKLVIQYCCFVHQHRVKDPHDAVLVVKLSVVKLIVLTVLHNCYLQEKNPQYFTYCVFIC